MKANRKADLQRKLALAPVPKPPAGLAERIKKDIPKDLRFDLEKDRERLSHSIGFSLRVAASILLVISTAYLSVNLLSRSKQASAPPAASIASDTMAIQAPKQIAANEEAAPLNDSVLRHPPVVPRRALLRKEADTPVAAVMTEPKVEAGATTNAQTARNDTVISAERRDAITVSESVVATAPLIAEAAPAAPPPASAPAPAPAPAVAAKSSARTLQVAVDSAPMSQTASAPDLVDRFAAPSVLPASGIAVDIEAVETPFADGKVFVRVSVDSGSSARDVRVEILLGEDLTQARWLAGSWRWAAALFDRRSTTSVAEAVVGTASDAAVAVVRVSYRLNGDEQTTEKTIRRNDVKAWSASTRRTKAAVLAAKSGDPAMRERIVAAAREAGLSELAAEIEKR